MFMDIQKLHDWAKVEEAKARVSYANQMTLCNYEEAIKYKKRYSAFASIIDAAGLLLKSAHGSKHRDFDHFANTVKGEVPAPLAETYTTKEVAGEGSVQPGAERQNEQTKKLPNRCKDHQRKKDGPCKFPMGSCMLCWSVW